MAKELSTISLESVLDCKLLAPDVPSSPLERLFSDGREFFPAYLKFLTKLGYAVSQQPPVMFVEKDQELTDFARHYFSKLPDLADCPKLQELAKVLKKDYPVTRLYEEIQDQADSVSGLLPRAYVERRQRELDRANLRIVHAAVLIEKNKPSFVPRPADEDRARNLMELGVNPQVLEDAFREAQIGGSRNSDTLNFLLTHARTIEEFTKLSQNSPDKDISGVYHSFRSISETLRRLSNNIKT